jgi:hypothetical protein
MEKWGFRYRKPKLPTVGIRCADHATPFYPLKLALTSPTSDVRLVGIVRLRTEAMKFLQQSQFTADIPFSCS